MDRTDEREDHAQAPAEGIEKRAQAVGGKPELGGEEAEDEPERNGHRHRNDGVAESPDKVSSDTF